MSRGAPFGAGLELSLYVGVLLPPSAVSFRSVKPPPHCSTFTNSAGVGTKQSPQTSMGLVRRRGALAGVGFELTLYVGVLLTPSRFPASMKNLSRPGKSVSATY